MDRGSARGAVGRRLRAGEPPHRATVPRRPRQADGPDLRRPGLADGWRQLIPGSPSTGRRHPAARLNERHEPARPRRPSLPETKGNQMNTDATHALRRPRARWMTGGGLLVLATALIVAGLLAIAANAQASPPMDKWVDPLPVPPVAQKTFKPGISSWADYYEIDMRASQHQFNAGLGPATVWTYAQPGQSPVLLGPTIVAQDGAAGGREVDQQPSHQPRRLPTPGLHRSDHRRIAGVRPRSGPSGRSDPAPSRRAQCGALRWNAYAVVDPRRHEG